jgi:hypothetical protein
MTITESAVRTSTVESTTSRPTSFARKVAWVLALLAGVALVVAGPVMFVKGVDGKSQVRANLKQEHIVTPADASIPNKPVVDAATAQAQADVIWKHMMESSGGRAYADIHRDAPAKDLAIRATLAQGDALRGSLLSAVLAWNIANLVMGLGALFTGLGVVFLGIGLAIRPRRAATS